MSAGWAYFPHPPRTPAPAFISLGKPLCRSVNSVEVKVLTRFPKPYSRKCYILRKTRLELTVLTDPTHLPLSALRLQHKHSPSPGSASHTSPPRANFFCLQRSTSRIRFTCKNSMHNALHVSELL